MSGEMTDAQRVLFLHELASQAVGFLQGVGIGVRYKMGDGPADAIESRASKFETRLAELLPEEDVPTQYLPAEDAS